MILQDKGAKNCKNNQKLCSCSLPLLADVQSALQLLLNTKKKALYEEPYCYVNPNCSHHLHLHTFQ